MQQRMMSSMTFTNDSNISNRFHFLFIAYKNTNYAVEV